VQCAILDADQAFANSSAIFQNDKANSEVMDEQAASLFCGRQARKAARVCARSMYSNALVESWQGDFEVTGYPFDSGRHNRLWFAISV
jgi:hypothetical protein